MPTVTAIPEGDWKALIDRIRGGESNRDDWNLLRSCFGGRVLTAIREELDDANDEAWKIDLPRKIQRDCWKQWKRTCETLPSDRSDFEAKLIEITRASAKRIAKEYISFQARITECRPQDQVEAALRSAFLPTAEEKKIEGLDAQVFEQMWHSRHNLVADCGDFNKRAFEFARTTGSLARKVVSYQLGDRQALEDLFKELDAKMIEICARAFPRIPADHREDICQNAALKLLRSAPRSFQPDRVATLTALVRTIIINAGIDWLKKNGDDA